MLSIFCLLLLVQVRRCVDDSSAARYHCSHVSLLAPLSGAFMLFRSVGVATLRREAARAIHAYAEPLNLPCSVQQWCACRRGERSPSAMPVRFALSALRHR